MKKLIPLLCATLLFICFLSSCDKDTVATNVTDPTDTTTTPIVTPMPLLSKFYAIDTTVTTPYDTFGRIYCYYDNLDRPIKVESYQTDRVNGDTSGIYSLRYYYNGTDTLASKSIEYDGHYTDTIYYTFLNGKIIADSSLKVSIQNSPYYEIHIYEYLPGSIVKVTGTAHYGPGYQLSISGTSMLYQTWDGLDIVHQVDTSRDTYPVSNDWSINEHTIVYISHPNPFARLADPRRRPKLTDDINLFAMREAPRKLFAAHSWTARSYTGSTLNYQNAEDAQYTYTFRADGYPAEFREIITDDGMSFYLKGVFVYE